MACGSVRSDRRRVSSARSLTAGDRPSGPPTRKATSRPSPSQTRRRSARAQGRQPRALLVEHHPPRALGRPPPPGAAPRPSSSARAACPRTRLGLDLDERRAALGRQALQVFGAGVVGPARHALADHRCTNRPSEPSRLALRGLGCRRTLRRCAVFPAAGVSALSRLPGGWRWALRCESAFRGPGCSLRGLLRGGSAGPVCASMPCPPRSWMRFGVRPRPPSRVSVAGASCSRRRGTTRRIRRGLARAPPILEAAPSQAASPPLKEQPDPRVRAGPCGPARVFRRTALSPQISSRW